MMPNKKMDNRKKGSTMMRFLFRLDSKLLSKGFDRSLVS